MLVLCLVWAQTPWMTPLTQAACDSVCSASNTTFWCLQVTDGYRSTLYGKRWNACPYWFGAWGYTLHGSHESFEMMAISQKQAFGCKSRFRLSIKKNKVILFWCILLWIFSSCKFINKISPLFPIPLVINNMNYWNNSVCHVQKL